MKDANGNEIPGTPPELPYAEGFAPQQAQLSDGPIGIAKKVYNNTTRGFGPAGLVSPDGSVGGSADEALNVATMGASGAAGAAPFSQLAAGNVLPGQSPSSDSMADDTPYPGTPGQMGASTDALDGVRDEMLLRMGLTNDNDAKAPGPFYAPAHEEYSQVGGKRGKELFNRAYGDGPDDGPTKLANAIRESEKAQGQRADELSKSYDNEAQRATQAAAARRMSTQADQQELQQRQQNLQMASQQYSNDLADTGKFWTNPGNIIAAISFSLMPIFSNDPTVGVKLVNQAIQQDLDNRRQNAQGALGALRSNLDGYHKLAGDRQAGDQLAEAEARRIAALDVERIMAKFESPISKAKGEALIQDLNIKTAQGYMQAFNQAKIFSPAAKQDPELYKLRTQGYPGAWQGMNDVAPIQPVGAAVNGSVAGSPSLATGQSFTSHVAPGVQMVIKAGAPASVAAKLAMDNRIPGSSNMYTLLSTYVNRAAINEAKGGGPQVVAAKKQEIVDKAAKQIEAVPGLTTGGTTSIAGRKATLADLQASAEIIRASESAHGRDPKDFLGSMRAIVGDSIANKYDQLERTFQSRDGLSPAAARQRTRDQAVMDFRQKLSMQISSAYNDISGGAISATELPRLEASISGSSDFGFAYGWLQTKSKDIQDKEKQATVGLDPIAKMLYLTRTGVGQRPSGLPVRPTAGPKKAPEGNGEVSYDPTVASSGARPYSGTIGGKPGER
jgi:hypothetical protein